ncbi:MAG: type II toxin-antitoxin system ParD family antitoxin [Chloracidobacterium sp.]|nr:type II toxin-antitoxin system ParD family antitoxin [Chloracidobacterium sp.]
MKRTTFNISLPEAMGSFVRRRIENRYGSVSEYIRELIRNDQKRAVGASSPPDFEAARREKYNSYRDPLTGKWRS